jgi:F0F1-type ATP synthase assembly protein I
MIKSLLGEDENTETNEDKSEQETTSAVPPAETSAEAVKTPDPETEEEVATSEEVETIDTIRTAIETEGEPPADAVKTEEDPPPSEPVIPFEIDRPIGRPTYEREDAEEAVSEPESGETSRTSELEKKLREIEEELRKEKEIEVERERRRRETEQRQAAEIRPVEPLAEVETVVTPREETETIVMPGPPEDESFPVDAEKPVEDQVRVKPLDHTPVSKAESLRNSGMAWSAAIALFGAVVVMLIIGWFADLFFGSSPWGIVGGIFIGAIIGFVQFFRITAQIVNPKPSDFEKVSLASNLRAAKETNDEETVMTVAEESPETSELAVENTPTEEAVPTENFVETPPAENFVRSAPEHPAPEIGEESVAPPSETESSVFPAEEEVREDQPGYKRDEV